MLQQRSTTDTTSLAEVLFEQQRLMLEREEKTEAKADKLWQEMRHQMDKMREKMQLAPPAEAISEELWRVCSARSMWPKVVLTGESTGIARCRKRTSSATYLGWA